ncbi:Chromosome segregation in meiosis protein 3 [Colletotrichum chlorophyti]|uniref:Chromosome segregation in meiosis protein n=1 Tax=Colletotrichum chlorophyti TaxID=708187 RepID=A0A1Q8S0H0_9PEZI|nr:Chromosome segregation in meiosis protein 3 [Colletotrichum chlorophyti]
MSTRTIPEYDDLDNYAVDEFDDPFKTPPPEANDGKATKRKKPDALGLDEEVEVVKRMRIPRVKLDETRLLSNDGIPKLRKRAANLRFKGKGHEFSDAARLLSFYQLWLDDLFPKAKFLDALAMVEKAGHKKQLVYKRMDWINESKPKLWEADENRAEKDVEPINQQTDEVTRALTPSTIAQHRPKTPDGDVPDDDDIYGATPQIQSRTREEERLRLPPEEPDDDDLDALMAEADAATQVRMSSRQALSDKQAPVDVDEDEEAAMAEMDGLW